jgi:hypothetical protein
LNGSKILESAGEPGAGPDSSGCGAEGRGVAGAAGILVCPEAAVTMCVAIKTIATNWKTLIITVPGPFGRKAYHDFALSAATAP